MALSEPGSSPYATGGGGVVLEHHYAATLLAALLVGDPVPELGQSAAIEWIAFQASRFSPVDDIVIQGTVHGPDCSERRLSIGVRRRPTMAKSDEKFVALLGTMLRVVVEHWDAVAADRWRIGLAVAAPNTGAAELRRLSEMARRHPSQAELRDAVAAPRRTTTEVRKRLTYLDEAVDSAVRSTVFDLPSGSTGELTWRLLCGLRVIVTDIEDDDSSVRVACVTRLCSITNDPGDAAGLFEALVSLADSYVPSGAMVTMGMLRRDLTGRVQIASAPSQQRAWRVITSLSDRLRSRTGRRLVAPAGGLELPRADLRARLVDAMMLTSKNCSGLIVTGEPDVGKSSLTLVVVDDLIAAGAVAHSLSLRDLPQNPLDLEQVLGASITEVLASAAVASVRVVIVDGAEAVIEGWAEIFAEVTRATTAAGMAIVAVTRSDAATSAREGLRDAIGEEPATIEVPPLDGEEVAEIHATFAALARVALDPRSKWLLARPGLVDMLLRADTAASLPDGPLSEADVFAAVWYRLVRRSEYHGPGDPSPDGREQCLLALARRDLASGTAGLVVDTAALPSLRSDGLLLAPGPHAAWISGDQFATDLIRDFAVARLLVVDGIKGLEKAGAPRWAVRAARLAAQAQLARGVTAWLGLQSEFAELAAGHGERWTDIPFEAALSLGAPMPVLDSIWPGLIANRGEGLQRLTRLISQRHTTGDMSDPVVAAPIVELCLDHQGDLVHLSHNVIQAVDKVMTAWLRGLAMRSHDDISDALRCRIRGQLLAGPIEDCDDKTVERLALLGVDLNDATEHMLRSVAADRPAYLDLSVESATVAISMAIHRPELLLILAESYYIERPATHQYRWPVSNPLGGGVRFHRHRGLGAPFAAWYYGPFLLLLRVRTLDAIAFINRLLDHAAQTRITVLGESTEASEPGGADIELPGIGKRHLVGDSHVWFWYRGSSVGPYPCMSALLAVERFADELRSVGLPLQPITKLLLADCHNLAMVGLVVGFLVRHIDHITGELDRFLVQPILWDLEYRRAAYEGHLHAQGPDGNDVTGHARRTYTFREVAATLVTTAMEANDSARLAGLSELADELIENANTMLDETDISNRAMIHSWASTLRSICYCRIEIDDGQYSYEFHPPVDVEEALAEQNEDLARHNSAWRLISTYAIQEDRRPQDLTNLVGDIEIGRDLLANPPAPGSPDALMAAAAVAAAAVIAHGEGRQQLIDDHLEWAAGTVVCAAIEVPSKALDYHGSFFAWGADRSAAASAPALLLPSFHEAAPGTRFDSDDVTVIVEALVALTTSQFDEVRRVVGNAFTPVWKAPCAPITGTRGCRHQVALQAVAEGLRDCRLGPLNNQGRREPLSLEGPIVQALDEVAGGDLLLNSLTGPLVAAAGCAIAGCCASSDARTLLDDYLCTVGSAQRVSPGLDWLYAVIDRDYGRFASRCWRVPRWLADLRKSAILVGNARVQFQSIVDGLADAGDNRVVSIQRAEEGEGPD